MYENLQTPKSKTRGNMILVFKNHKTSNQIFIHSGSKYLGNQVLGHQQGGKNQRRTRTWGHGRFFASWRLGCYFFCSKGGGNLLWVLCLSYDQTLRAQQNKLHKNKHNTTKFIIQISSSYLFPPILPTHWKSFFAIFLFLFQKFRRLLR